MRGQRRTLRRKAPQTASVYIDEVERVLYIYNLDSFSEWVNMMLAEALKLEKISEKIAEKELDLDVMMERFEEYKESKKIANKEKETFIDDMADQIGEGVNIFGWITSPHHKKKIKQVGLTVDQVYEGIKKRKGL